MTAPRLLLLALAAAVALRWLERPGGGRDGVCGIRIGETTGRRMTMATTKRDEWTFEYSTAELLSAAHEREAHHTERLAHWTKERDAREEKLRADGIDIRAAVRAGVSNSTAYYDQPTLDADLLHALQEAQERVDFHNDRQVAFARWVRALQHDDQRMRDLTVQDIEFFGL